MSDESVKTFGMSPVAAMRGMILYYLKENQVDPADAFVPVWRREGATPWYVPPGPLAAIEAKGREAVEDITGITRLAHPVVMESIRAATDKMSAAIDKMSHEAAMFGMGVSKIDASGSISGVDLYAARSLWPVTPPMQNVGGRAANDVCLSLFNSRWNSQDAEQIAVAAYRAMAALAPPTITDADGSFWRDQALAMENERDAALARIDGLQPENARLVHEVATLRDRNWHAQQFHEEAKRALAAKDARIAELDTMLAQRPAPAAVVNPGGTFADRPVPTALFRDFPGDPRRMGP